MLPSKATSSLAGDHVHSSLKEISSEVVSSQIASIVPSIVSVPSTDKHAVVQFFKKVALTSHLSNHLRLISQLYLYSKIPQQCFLYSLFPVPDFPFSQESIWFTIILLKWLSHE